MEEEIEVVKRTTVEKMPEANIITSQEELIMFQNLVRRVPVNDNILKYAVNLTANTRPNTASASDFATQYIAWGRAPFISISYPWG